MKNIKYTMITIMLTLSASFAAGRMNIEKFQAERNENPDANDFLARNNDNRGEGESDDLPFADDDRCVGARFSPVTAQEDGPLKFTFSFDAQGTAKMSQVVQIHFSRRSTDGILEPLMILPADISLDGSTTTFKATLEVQQGDEVFAQIPESELVFNLDANHLSEPYNCSAAMVAEQSSDPSFDRQDNEKTGEMDSLHQSNQ